jgi:hypothetical protein
MTNEYMIKATQPAGNPWQERNLTQVQAVTRAKWFAREWVLNGLVTAEATVFNHHGRIDAVINRESL